MIIEMTEEARKKIDDILEKKDPKELSKKRLRIYVSSSGWGGIALGLVLEEPEEEDLKVDIGAYKFAIADGLADSYAKFMIVFRDSKYRKSFSVLARKNMDDTWD